VARLARARGLRVVANVRSEARASALAREGFDVLALPALGPDVAAHVDASTHVVVAFPPDGGTDARVAPALGGAAAVTYVSSTGVYGDHRGVVDDRTPLAASPRAAKTLAAEALYRVHRRHREEARGATVLRCPGIYGRERGLHARIVRGEHRIPGDGTRFLSRIHADDLAALILASAAKPSDTFVVGDLEPAPHIEVVRFVCEAYGVPLPPFVPLESVHESLRADRRVDGARARAELGVTFNFPTYREGMAPAATGLAQRRLKIHETYAATGEASLTHLTVEDGALALVLDAGAPLPLDEGALDAVMARFGGPLETSEPVIAVGALDLPGGGRVRHVRHLARYDVIARDFLVHEVPGREPVCALAVTVSAALAHLARARARR
jgi:nucleoside-diphosphate-sugar epimerase